jgi:hypothetical protein
MKQKMCSSSSSSSSSSHTMMSIGVRICFQLTITTNRFYKDVRALLKAAAAPSPAPTSSTSTRTATRCSMGIDCIFVLLVTSCTWHYLITMTHSLFVVNMRTSQGTIVWERWQLEEFLQARKRVCHVSNVCWANGRLTLSCPPLLLSTSCPCFHHRAAKARE